MKITDLRSPGTPHHWVDRVGIPLLVAFTVGMVVGSGSQHHQTDNALQEVRQARQLVARVQADLQQWRQACEPLVAMPVLQAPMVYSGPLEPRTVAGGRP